MLLLYSFLLVYFLCNSYYELHDWNSRLEDAMFDRMHLLHNAVVTLQCLLTDTRWQQIT